MSNYDRWLDRDLDDYYSDDEDFEISWSDEPDIIPSDDYDNYDGWNDMQ